MLKNNFTLGPFTIHFYGLIISFSILAGYLFVVLRSKAYQIPRNVVDNLFLLTLVFGIFGARLYHVLDEISYYKQYPIEIFYVWQGGLGIYGALIFGLLVIYVFAKINKLPVLTLLDLVSPAVALAQSIGRWGNFINMEAFGPPTSLPWGIYIPVRLRPEKFISFEKFHPAFFYESVLTFLTFLVLTLLSFKIKNRPGLIFALYVISYSTIRLVVENFRIDTWVINSFKVAQITSVALLIVGIFLLFTILKKPQNAKNE